MDTVLAQVESHLTARLGMPSGRAGITFLGAERVEVLRFGPDGNDVVRYVTVGMSASPLPDPTSDQVAPIDGPRCELVLSLRGLRDDVLRALATAAMSPFVEGAIVVPGASLDLGEPLWPGSRFSALLVTEPGVLADCPTDYDPVQFLPVVPLTANEAAYKRVQGLEALEERLLTSGVDPLAPDRPEVSLA